MQLKKIALVCLSPPVDGDEMPLPMPSYGIHRIHAAAKSAGQGADIRMFDLGRSARREVFQDIAAFEPDLIGFSVYVWSTGQSLKMAADLRKVLPKTIILFGGPSARRSVFDLAPWRVMSKAIDALCEGDGEAVIQDVMSLPVIDHDALATVGGLVIHQADGSWKDTAPARSMSMQDIPSPYELGTMPMGAVAYLETFRGCPLGCRFCEWGITRAARDVFSADCIAAELAHFRKLQAPAVFLLDAGLNLNARAFRNLVEAQNREGFLSEALFWAEIYPTAIKEDHIEFLRNVGTSYLGVGLQSIDPVVLAAQDRPYDMSKLGPSVERLAEVANQEVQIILGLPGDTPDGFRRTLDYALSLPVWAVRVYHCLVLPDALLTRSRPEWRVQFDPRTMAMVSNSGWSKEDIAAMRQQMVEKSQIYGGNSGEYWWSFRL
jgi:radical SAM superfamily enzyme YgiQ (UPF0313 family)